MEEIREMHQKIQILVFEHFFAMINCIDQHSVNLIHVSSIGNNRAKNLQVLFWITSIDVIAIIISIGFICFHFLIRFRFVSDGFQSRSYPTCSTGWIVEQFLKNCRAILIYLYNSYSMPLWLRKKTYNSAMLTICDRVIHGSKGNGYFLIFCWEQPEFFGEESNYNVTQLPTHCFIDRIGFLVGSKNILPTVLVHIHLNILILTKKIDVNHESRLSYIQTAYSHQM